MPGNFLFCYDTVIVAERIPDKGGDSGYFPMGQAVKSRHVGTALDDQKCNSLYRQRRKFPGKPWCGIMVLPLAFSVQPVTFGAPAPVNACALLDQLLQ